MEALNNENSRLRQGIKNGEFVVTFEVVPGRGANENMQDIMFDLAQSVWNTGRVHAISVTDSPGGTPALSPEIFSHELWDVGVEPLVHLTCRDRNRNGLESALYTMQRYGLNNALSVTGDCTNEAWRGVGCPSFDLDSVTLLQMMKAMNSGMPYMKMNGQQARLENPSDFFAGAVVSPFKWTEAEVMTQFYKLKKKVYAGAQFVISQVGYSPRKMHEMLLMMRNSGLDVPIFANVFMLSGPTAKFLSKGCIAGCYVSDELRDKVLKEVEDSDDKGNEACCVRAAKMIAIAKGLGYAGVHMGGMHLDAENLVHILDLAKEFETSWRDYIKEQEFAKKDCWWRYKFDEESGLNLPEQNTISQDYFDEPKIQGNYRASRKFHEKKIRPGSPSQERFMKKMRKKDERYGRTRPHASEYARRSHRFGCKDCGDCGLEALAYSCPMSDCPKHQRNGACGGSTDGYCEKYPGERFCIWYKAYHRLKHYGEQEELGDYIVPPNNWAYWESSAWSNKAQGRDAMSHCEYLPGSVEKYRDAGKVEDAGAKVAREIEGVGADTGVSAKSEGKAKDVK